MQKPKFLAEFALAIIMMLILLGCKTILCSTPGTTTSTTTTILTSTTTISTTTTITPSATTTTIISTTVAAPTFKPEPGTYTTAQEVSIATSTPDASIRYMTDGGTPTVTVGALYESPVPITSTKTIKTIAYKTGCTNSPVSTALYTITGSVAAPVFSLESGIYTSEQTIKISCTLAGAIIRYTTDGSSPISSPTGTIYLGSISVASSTTLKAIAYKTDWLDSDITTANYIITGTVTTPYFSVSAGTYTAVQNVTISCPLEGVSIRYTINGLTPSPTSGILYSGPVAVEKSLTLKAIAYKTDWLPSALASTNYTLQVAAPCFSLESGAYPISQDVMISSTSPGVNINYTIDGSIPTSTASLLYENSISIESTRIINAIGYKTGWLPSTMSSARYVIISAMPVAKVACGYCYSMILKADSSLWATGYNSCGQLGEGTTTDKLFPIMIMSNVQDVKACDLSTMIIKTDGTLWAVGLNDHGQLGDGTVERKLTPVQVQITGNVQMVAVGHRFAMILKTDGTVWATGSNGSGQLGDGTKVDKSIPVQVMSGVKYIAAGINHTLFIKTDDTLWAVGDNHFGQLGDGTHKEEVLPVQVMTEVLAVAAGEEYTMILKTDGTLWATGRNTYGQLGDRTNISKLTPVQIMDGVQNVSVGRTHTLILKTDDTLWSFGEGGWGRLGNGSNTNSSVPTKIFSNVQSLAAGENHTMIIKTDGTLWANGSSMALGDGSIENKLYPIQIM